MDPITLFAMANAAVSAVKAGCKLYKDIKGAAGEVKEVLKDLDDQFHKLHPPNKPATIEQHNAYVQERNRVVELNKKANNNEHSTVYQELGEHLGAYYDNYFKCIAIFEEEERQSKTKLYEGDSSLGKRALQRVLMKKQLEQMGTELREIMIYQSPPELGALYSDVEAMMKVMGEEQKVLLTKQIKREAIEKKRQEERSKHLRNQAIIGLTVIFVIFCFMFLMMWIAWDRQQKYPQYGNELIPRDINRKEEKFVYIGR
jgi:Fe2+ transport system protein B